MHFIRHIPTQLLSLTLALLVLNCAEPRPARLIGPESPPKPEEYTDILDTWTRKSSIYQVFDQKLFISATYHSPEFRRAFAVAFPDIYGHGGAITKRELVDLTGDVENFHNFFKPGNDLLFRALRQSTIGAEGLDFRVRNGIGYYTFAIITRQRSYTLILFFVNLSIIL